MDRLIRFRSIILFLIVKGLHLRNKCHTASVPTTNCFKLIGQLRAPTQGVEISWQVHQKLFLLGSFNGLYWQS